MGIQCEGEKPIVRCCICVGVMEYEKRYGRDGCCCCKECYQELEWRRALVTCGKPYRIDDRRIKTPNSTPDRKECTG